MREIFEKSKIKFSDLLDQVQSYVSDVFEQSGRVFSVASAWGQIIKVLEGLTKMILYYIEDSVTELNINTASRPESIYGEASRTGHNPMRGISSQGEIEINYNGGDISDIQGNSVIIPNYTRIRCLDNGLVYTFFLPGDEVRMELNVKKKLGIKLHQGEVEFQSFTGSGYPLQTFNLPLKSGKITDHFFNHVYVNGELYPQFNSIYDIPRDQPGVILRTGIQGGLNLAFGNGYFGKIPPFGSEIKVEYLITNGADGDIRGNDIKWQFMDQGYDVTGNEVDLNSITNITVKVPINFGANPEPLELTRLLVPLAAEARVLSNENSYVYFLERLNYFSIIHAYRNLDEGFIDDYNVMYLFLVPNITRRIASNENYFTVPQTYFTLSSSEKDKIYTYLEESDEKVTGSVVKIIDPIVKMYVLNIVITIFEGEGGGEEGVKQSIVSKLSDYFLNIRRLETIPRSDLIGIVESVDGVDSVNLNFISREFENALVINPNATNEHVDEFGDITMKANEIALIRGGWKDHNGQYYHDLVDFKKPCSINIYVKKTIKAGAEQKWNNTNIRRIKGTN